MENQGISYLKNENFYSCFVKSGWQEVLSVWISLIKWSNWPVGLGARLWIFPGSSWMHCQWSMRNLRIREWLHLRACVNFFKDQMWLNQKWDFRMWWNMFLQVPISCTFMHRTLYTIVVLNFNDVSLISRDALICSWYLKTNNCPCKSFVSR